MRFHWLPGIQDRHVGCLRCDSRSICFLNMKKRSVCVGDMLIMSLRQRTVEGGTACCTAGKEGEEEGGTMLKKHWACILKASARLKPYLGIVDIDPSYFSIPT